MILPALCLVEIVGALFGDVEGSVRSLDVQRVWLSWEGTSCLPQMYEAALQQSIRIFGTHRITIMSQTLCACQPWYPSVWNASSIDLTLRMHDVHPPSTWHNFLLSVAQGPMAHEADFRRIALLYLYGGLYSDMDALWIRAPPGQFVVDTYNHQYLSNGAISVYKPKHALFKTALAMMPQHYNSKIWTSIGGPLLTKAMTSLDLISRQSFLIIPYLHMYTIKWTDAKPCFSTLRCKVNACQVACGKSYQLHMFGKMTGIAHDTRPRAYSMFDTVVKMLPKHTLNGSLGCPLAQCPHM